MTPYIQLIIEFLFEKYSESIKQRLGIPFIIHIILVVTMLATSELHRMHEAGIKPGILMNLLSLILRWKKNIQSLCIQFHSSVEA